jgi:signal transduction histidine kinase
MKQQRMPKSFYTNNFWSAFGFQNLDAEEFKKRTSAVNAAIFTVAAGICYSLVYVFLGFPYVTIAVIFYAICSISSLVYLRATHNFRIFKIIQLLLISFFPIATQLSIGGFINSSAVALAGFIAPATALLYAKAVSARRYFYLFVVLVICAALFESYFIEKRFTLPIPVVTTFFAINIIATLGIIYFLMESFLKKQEELRIELRQSLEDLKATQAQLIQSEKMASLGELTAGIAHEIQNPLNFVNNFSDVNTELLEELKEELTNGNQQEAISLANDIKENEQKINHHGKRADAIVRGMLQHSRKGSDKKEPTDINALADEYLRLSYHGLRAKDKSFNATLETDFDESIKKIDVVPQDVGRVLLNLFSNAFYAVSEKKKQLNGSFEPKVSVAISRGIGKVEITVTDNGNGIPQKILDKIYQPFFTTKPTGEGTGLGLSLSYDIIKAHGGEIKVNSTEGEGTIFKIQLPV